MRTQKSAHPPELTVQVQDFGPISAGKIALKPLTLLIGPNNSGKSYAAMLTHAIFESYTPTTLTPDAHFFADDVSVRASRLGSVAKRIEELVDRLRKDPSARETPIPVELVAHTCRLVFENIYEKRLTEEIVRSFGAPLKDLVRLGTETFRLDVDVNSYRSRLELRKSRLAMVHRPEAGFPATIRLTAAETIRLDPPKGAILVGRQWLQAGKGAPELGPILADGLVHLCASRIRSSVPAACYYLPAARSGMLQAHKSLVAGVLRRVPYAGIEQLEIPRLSGTVLDFLSVLVALPEQKGPLYKLAEDFERQIIRGQIVLSRVSEGPYPEIRYKFQTATIPLHRASSTVSELAPLFLFVKYLLRPGGFLIIEEPEAHLHPENQRLVAHFLVRLVRSGVSVVVTTHSGYLLDQLSMFIMAHRVDETKRRERFGYGPDTYLTAGETAAYLFTYDEPTGGHRIAELEVDEEEGITQEEFGKIQEAMGDELIMLRRDLEKIDARKS